MDIPAYFAQVPAEPTRSGRRAATGECRTKVLPRRKFLVIAAAAGLQACATVPGESPPRFDIQAHRGGRGLFPENTLPAFDNALRLGVATLELDIGLSADNVVVISHEPRLSANLARDASGHYLVDDGPEIRSLTYQQLQQYDLGRLKPGTAYARQFPQQVAVDHTPIPRLSDLFAMIHARGDRRIRFNIETKIRPDEPTQTADADTMVRALLAVIREWHMEKRVTIQSFDWRTLKIAETLAPAIPRVCLSMQQPVLDNIHAQPAGLWTAGLRLADAGSLPALVRLAGATCWSPYYRELDARQLAEAHALGLRVIPWTINQPETMRLYIEMGVDGIITDRPDRLLALHPAKS